MTPSALEDAELVRRCAAAGPDRAAAEAEVCRRYVARATRYGERHLRDANAARDLAQLVLLSVIEALRESRIEDPSRLGAFVLSTCRHLAWDANRALARRKRLDDALGMIEDAVASAPSALVLERKRLEFCVSSLPPREQRVVLLSYCEDWSAEQIANDLETTAGNVRVMRHRALGRLARCLEERMPSGAER